VPSLPLTLMGIRFRSLAFVFRIRIALLRTSGNRGAAAAFGKPFRPFEPSSKDGSGGQLQWWFGGKVSNCSMEGPPGGSS
jgi:hypothetical protein